MQRNVTLRYMTLRYDTYTTPGPATLRYVTLRYVYGTPCHAKNKNTAGQPDVGRDERRILPRYGAIYATLDRVTRTPSRPKSHARQKTATAEYRERQTYLKFVHAVFLTGRIY